MPRLQFFFERVSAKSFGLMRAAWAFVVLVLWLQKFPDVARYWSDAGILPRSLEHFVSRIDFRFTVLDAVGDPRAVTAMYIAFLAVLVLMMLGVASRLATVASVLLLFSFHERNPLPLGGGDTVLRLVGFLLMLGALAPGAIEAFSLDRARSEWREWRRTRAFLPASTMSAWLRRLLLWQLVVLYATSLWSKLLGTAWIQGTAVAIALHHPHFSRFPGAFADYASITSPVASALTLAFGASWLLLLIPRRVLQDSFRIQPGTLKRVILGWGVLFHVTIELLFEVGSFTWAMLVSYVGLLDEEDFDVMRRFANAGWRGDIAILYDGHCGLCQRSVFVVTLLDWLKRVRLVDFRNEELRRSVAPEISFEALDKSMHIKMPNGARGGRTENGFDAFRLLAWHLPPLWPIAPFLYVPGVPFVGRKVYAEVAARRKRCTHESCNI